MVASELMARLVDRSVVKMVAMKRIFTGTLSIVSGIILVTVFVQHGSRPTPLLGLALLIFWGGGTWSLRDGLRLRKALASGA